MAKGTDGRTSSGKPVAKTTPSKGKSPKKKAPPIAIKRPKPWGLIAATLVVVVFAGAVIGYAVYRVRANAPVDPAKGLADAAKIPGMYIVNPGYQGSQHVTDNIDYSKLAKENPPAGGEHDPTWADCTGTVYPDQIRTENAVHTLEHGAVWITYKPGLSQDDMDKLKKVVDGKMYTLMSPYPGQAKAISLTAWNHQLQLDSLDMKLVNRFLKDLRDNINNAPEPHGNCVNPDFKAAPLPVDTAFPSTSATPSGTPTGSESTPTATATGTTKP